MKKVLLSVICALLLLPMAVFADTKIIKYHANENMTVGGYKEVWLEASGAPTNTLHEIDLDFDTNYFSINKQDISIYFCSKDITNLEGIDISVLEGKVSIKSTKEIDMKNCVGTPNYVINLKFNAKKAGNSDIRLYGDSRYSSNGGPIDVRLKSTIVNSDCTENTTTKCLGDDSSSRYFEALVIVIIACFGSVILLIQLMILISITKQKKNCNSCLDKKKSESKE